MLLIVFYELVKEQIYKKRILSYVLCYNFTTYLILLLCTFLQFLRQKSITFLSYSIAVSQNQTTSLGWPGTHVEATWPNGQFVISQ